MKELPKMYRNKIEKEITNNRRIFSTIDGDGGNIKKIVKEDAPVLNNGKTVEQKIASIFNSPNYIYKIDVIIVTDKEEKKKRIVGKTTTNLITMDREYIPINSIRDIYIDK